MARPKGTSKGMLPNGVVDEERLFLFIKRESIPKSEQKRFLSLCDRLITSLGADTLEDADIEEIALIYRDRIFMDMAYVEFAEAEAIDASMVNQIEKINKSLEVRKTNLGSRFIDREKNRGKDISNSFLDLFNHYINNKEAEAEKADEINKKIKKHRKQITNLDEYMKNKVGNNIGNNQEDK